MGNINQYFPSQWLRSEDLNGPSVVTIIQVRDVKFPGQRGESDQVKPVLVFQELEKDMIVNKTNFQALSKITGRDSTDEWIGSKVQLRVEQVNAFGDVVDAIRIRPAPRAPRVEVDDEYPDWVTETM